MPEIELEEEQVEGQEQVEQQEEQSVDLPEHAGGRQQTRQEIIDEAFEGAESEGVLGELADKQGELTAEDLRRLPGTEGLSDAQLEAEWKKAIATASEGKATADGKTPEAFKSPVPIYDDKGNKVEDISKITLQDFLSGKVQIGYQALDKEQRKAFADLVRVAQLGHHNERARAQSIAERNAIHGKYTESQKTIDQWSNDRKVWDAALVAYVQGNPKPMEALAKAYAAELSKMPTVTPGMVSEESARAQVEADRMGQQYYYETIVPKATDLATRYGANPKEVAATALWLINQEPPEFLTREKIEGILAYELPAVLEQNGYTVNGKVAQTGGGTTPDNSGEVAELKKQLAALQATVAEKANGKTEQARQKVRKAPPAGGGSIPGAGDSMPSFKTREGMKEWLRS